QSQLVRAELPRLHRVAFDAAVVRLRVLGHAELDHARVGEHRRVVNGRRRVGRQGVEVKNIGRVDRLQRAAGLGCRAVLNRFVDQTALVGGLGGAAAVRLAAVAATATTGGEEGGAQRAGAHCTDRTAAGDAVAPVTRHANSPY